MISINYPSGRVVTHNYDAIGRLSAVLDGAANLVNGFTYNSAGQVTAFSYGNGVAAALGYSADRLQLTSLAYTKGAQKLLDLAYGYGSGNNGQIQSITDNTGTQEMGRSTTYTYDALHRLKTAVTSGSVSYPQWGLQWSYDRYGNRLSQSATAGNPPAGSWSYADPGGAQTNRPDGYAHDAKGNMTNDGANALTYDAADRLVSSTGGSASGAYTYDAAGLRVKKVSAGTTTVYIYSGN